MTGSLQVFRRVLGARPWKNQGFPRFFVMSDSQRLPDPKRLLSSLPKDSAIIFRHYDAPNREQMARELVTLAHRKNIKVLIAGDWKLAHRCRADGVHWPEHLLGRLPGRPRSLKKSWLTSGAVHSRRNAAKAKAVSLDLAFISPVFPTKSHSGKTTLGPYRLEELRILTGSKAIALGGLSLKTVRKLTISKPWGIAGIGLFKD